jgi:hypothetical protein
MEDLYFEATNKTPKVSFCAADGKLEIIGRSIPENSYKFYEPVLQWLDEYIDSPAEKTELTFKLDYFNTSSSMYILGILKKLEFLHEKGHAVQVKWYYDVEDEDMMQTGEDLKQIVKLPIEILEIDQEEA